ncbi:beta-lactamase family protein [Acholeplasma sp. OttesenSCG-928-E16]|nr:beta-lactamase family protein [Acholeplasma sp. OttesenSCG-928-E16]
MLNKIKNFLLKNNINYYQIAVYDGNKINYQAKENTHFFNNVYSLSKSITATAIGILEYQGMINLDDKMSMYLNDYLKADYDKKLEDVTIKHLLSNSMGQDEGFLFGNDIYKHNTNDYVSLILSKKLKYFPGEKMVYTNTNYYLLSVIIEKITKRPAFEFIRDALFIPLSFNGYAAGTCPKGHTFGASNYFLNAVSILKLGILYLNNGIYDGIRYLSESFIKEATSIKAPYKHRYYGYGFWINDLDNNFFYGDGAHGQIMAVYKKTNKVIVITGYEDNFDYKEIAYQLEKLCK